AGPVFHVRTPWTVSQAAVFKVSTPWTFSQGLFPNPYPIVILHVHPVHIVCIPGLASVVLSRTALSSGAVHRCFI
ncbi:MAG: hypothetical protein LUD51_03990, partial [Clostridia bacterium]|nr:hypothetical protein [Clostridia bacterium]